MTRIPIEKIKVDESGKVIIDDPDFARLIGEAMKSSGAVKPLLNILCGCNVPCL